MCRGAALAATGAARSHARAGVHMAGRGRRRLARRAGHPLGFGADPPPAGAEERPPAPAPVSADRARPRWESDPGTLGSPGWGPPSPRVWSLGGKDLSWKAQPLHAPYKGQGLFPPRPPKFVFLSLCVRFFKVLSQSFP